jgi:hypothetical protein
MFKVAEINRQTEVAAEWEKDEKYQVEYHARQGAALPIVNRLENELENNVAWLTSKELEVLLQWKGVPVSKMGNIANRQVLYQQFAEECAEEVGIPAPWTEIDQVELDALRNASIELSNSVCVCFWPPVPKWGPVKHEIPISSPPLDDIPSIP